MEVGVVLGLFSFGWEVKLGVGWGVDFREDLVGEGSRGGLVWKMMVFYWRFGKFFRFGVVCVGIDYGFSI